MRSGQVRTQVFSGGEERLVDVGAVLDVNVVCWCITLVAVLQLLTWWRAESALRIRVGDVALKRRVRRSLRSQYGSNVAFFIALAVIQWRSGRATLLLALTGDSHDPYIIAAFAIAVVWLSFGFGRLWNDGEIEDRQAMEFLQRAPGLSPTGTRIVGSVVTLSMITALLLIFFDVATRRR